MEQCFKLSQHIILEKNSKYKVNSELLKKCKELDNLIEKRFVFENKPEILETDPSPGDTDQWIFDGIDEIAEEWSSKLDNGTGNHHTIFSSALYKDVYITLNPNQAYINYG